MRAPEFWTGADAGSRLLSRALSPFGYVYGASVAWKAKHQAPYRARAKVICVGGLTVGGSGKTPVAIVVAKALRKKGLNPVFLTRGYRGRLSGPLWVDPDRHSARDVGDEPLLLRRVARVVLARDRRAGAAIAGECDAIIMDGRHQKFQTCKDASIF